MPYRPAGEATNTTLPPPPASRAPIPCLAVRKAPVRFTSIVRCQASRSRRSARSSRPVSCTAAFGTTRSSPPNACVACATASRIASSSDTSAISASSPGAPACRSTVATCAPSASRRAATARPMPLAPPVTSARLPERPFTPRFCRIRVGTARMSTLMTTPARPHARSALRRQLNLFGTVAVSIGVMAPTLAMSVTGVEPARLLGRAAPLAFVFAAIGVGLVAYGFVRLSGEFAHAGSVYGFVGHAFGPRAGFFCGWALLGTYLVFPAVSMAGVAVFSQAFLKSTGIASGFPWYPLALFGWAVIAFAASREVRKGISAQVFDLPPGTQLSTIGLAAVFGFLSFAGFESAGSFGEEAHRPRRAIPYSLWAAIGVGGAFYVICMVIQTLGFGTDAAGVKAFSSSTAPLGDLAQAYMGSGMADALNLAAVISSFGAGMGCASVGARMLYALG